MIRCTLWVLLAMWAAAGCGTTQPADSTALLGDGYHLDLSSPPARAEVGLAPGQATTVRNLPDQATFQAAVTFADGTTLSTPANVLIASADANDEPRRVELVRYAMTEADVDEALNSAVDDLDATPQSVRAALETLRGTAPARFQRTISTGVGAGDSLELIIAVDPDSDDIHLTYGISLR